MSNEQQHLYKFGGTSFIASGVCFLAKACLDLMTGSPPATGAGILAWVGANRLALSLTSEVLFFAAVALVPAVAALYQSMAGTDRIKAVIGCGIIAVVIPVIAVLLIVHGRFVYPVYGLRIDTPQTAELALGIYYGGMHAVGLLMAIATVVLSLAMLRGSYGKPMAYFGFATSVFDIAGAYPYAIGPMLTFVCQVILSAWFMAVGAKLYRTNE
jgi:hypothetical protein